MFGKNFTTRMINRSAETPDDRRRFLKYASAAGLGVAGAGVLGAVAGPAASADADEGNRGVSGQGGHDARVSRRLRMPAKGRAAESPC